MAVNRNLTEKEEVAEDLINKKIKEKLEYLDIDYNALSKKIQEYLYKIESIISDKTSTQRKSLEVFKNTSFSFNSIAEAMDISRTTLYNNDSLKIYINHSKDVFDQDDPYAAFDKLKNSKTELERQIDSFVVRDVESEMLKQEISTLNKKLAEKEKEIQSLRKRKKEIAAEKKALEIELKQLNKSLETEIGSKVTSFKKGHV